MSASERHRQHDKTSGRLAIGWLLGAAAYFFLIEHREHLFIWLPYTVLLACPFIDILMHSRANHGQQEAAKECDQEAYERGFSDALARNRTDLKRGIENEQ
jgi:hypothetical protein